MAEKSLLWDTNGTGDGTGTGFTETDMLQLFRSLFTRTANMGGVAPDFLNELAVSGTSSPVAVNTGAALVYGIVYWNTASVNVAIATPAVSTRVDRIVLRADWTAQTARITRIAGTEGAGTPAMTQSAGTTWDIPLATVSITTGGVITVTDAREWLLGTGDGTIDATKLASDAVTTAKILDANVTTAKIADGAVTASKLTDGAALSEILDDDGSGSGLDADLLDGNHAVAFATSSHTHDPRTGLAGTNGVIADTANGDARGTDAVDLQTLRSVSTQVASGNNSVVGGGNDNTASGSGATVGGGQNNTASGVDATVNGGQVNAATGNFATIGGGDNNTASGVFGTIPGGSQASALSYGEFAYAGGQPLATGNQMSLYVAGNVTTNNTQTTLYLDGATGTQRMSITSDSTWAFRALIAARRTDADNESAAYEITGCIDNNAGTVALVGTITKTVIAEDNAGWDVTAEADNSNDALLIKVTGENAKTIRWVAVVYVTKVLG